MTWRYFILALQLAALFVTSSPAQTPDAPGAVADPLTNTAGTLSVSSPLQVADWQRRLTLGPGDLLSISLYEQSDSTRPGTLVGPDGRINYLQARDVMAAGLTIDELREALENALLKFYRPPLRVIILPQLYQSKKYFLLGNVVQRGVFRMDGPITIIEAVAKAQGFAAGLEARENQFGLADLPRSFLIRRDSTNSFRREAVDFEALFLRGDLSQNIPLAPDDYLYFPPPDSQEVYVLGDVARPGASRFSSGQTAVGALAAHGGFTDRAYRKRVLIVRGSLNHPQTYVLNLPDVMNAKSLDFRLEPRDIVYVSRKPWYKAEELLEAAISDFARSAVVTWTGFNVGPIIKEPFIK
jgi:protein involved in polysaccharide export with SLBB domain